MHTQLQWLRWIGLLPALLAMGWTPSSSAQTNDDGESRVTAKITLGPSEGAARPMKRGQAITGGGSIEVRQPASDTLVIRMTGSAGACGNLLSSAEATLDFYENLQFAVEFSEPGCTGTLKLSSRLHGVLSGNGKHSTVGVGDAMATVTIGPEPIATVTIPGRAVGCDESLAINASQGPVCAPIGEGCYHLHQEYRLFAMQPKSCSCGKAIAEFAPSSLSSTWLGLSYPFKDVDKSRFGYEVTIRVIPDP